MPTATIRNRNLRLDPTIHRITREAALSCARSTYARHGQSSSMSPYSTPQISVAPGRDDPRAGGRAPGQDRGHAVDSSDANVRPLVDERVRARVRPRAAVRVVEHSVVRNDCATSGAFAPNSVRSDAEQLRRLGRQLDARDVRPLDLFDDRRLGAGPSFAVPPHAASNRGTASSAAAMTQSVPCRFIPSPPTPRSRSQSSPGRGTARVSVTARPGTSLRRRRDQPHAPAPPASPSDPRAPRPLLPR